MAVGGIWLTVSVISSAPPVSASKAVTLVERKPAA
jgi:hypothetical protein